MNPRFEINEQSRLHKKDSVTSSIGPTTGFQALPMSMGFPMGMSLPGAPSERPEKSLALSLLKDPSSDIVSQQEMASWLIWCQSCKHGGHAGCMTQWFANFAICPVSDCNCECSIL